MIIILKQDANEAAVRALRAELEAMGLSIHESLEIGRAHV